MTRPKLSQDYVSLEINNQLLPNKLTLLDSLREDSNAYRQSQEADIYSLHSILLLNLGHLRAAIVRKKILESNHNKNQLLFSKVYPESSI